MKDIFSWLLALGLICIASGSAYCSNSDESNYVKQSMKTIIKSFRKDGVSEKSKNSAVRCTVNKDGSLSGIVSTKVSSTPISDSVLTEAAQHLKFEPMTGSIRTPLTLLIVLKQGKVSLRPYWPVNGKASGPANARDIILQLQIENGDRLAQVYNDYKIKAASDRELARKLGHKDPVVTEQTDTATKPTTETEAKTTDETEVKPGQTEADANKK